MAPTALLTHVKQPMLKRRSREIASEGVIKAQEWIGGQDKPVVESKILATNYAIEELNKAFGKMAKSINRKKGIIKMTYKPLKKVNVRELKEKDTQEVEFQCTICNHHTKVLYCAGASKIFCPYCGVDL